MNYYTGNSLQIRGAERYVLQGGKGDGMHFLYIRNGLGLEVWISLDRAGDVSRVSFRGDNMGYFAPCGYVAPSYYDREGAGFLKSFTAGFFTTCGLTAVGAPCVDNGEKLPMHGTVSHIPAELIAIEDKNTELVVKLRVTDASLFGSKLVMDRKYTFSYTQNTFEVQDTVTNVGDGESPFMILYHCNMGYPLLSESSIIKIPYNTIKARDKAADEYIKTALIPEPPQSDFKERCYYFDMKDEDGVKAGIYNPDIKKGVVMEYDKKQLPFFTEWKMMGKKDYVLGLEPGNCTPDGRDIMRKNGTLRFLQPETSATTKLKFTFVTETPDF